LVINVLSTDLIILHHPEWQEVSGWSKAAHICAQSRLWLSFSQEHMLLSKEPRRSTSKPT
jgi:hypothetical protein